MTEPRPIGLVAPLPPQTGGVASFAQWLLDNAASIGCTYHTFDLQRPPEDETGGRLRADAVPRQARLSLRFVRWVRRAPPVVHYCVALTATGLPRDLLFIALLRSAQRRTIAHVHGPALDGGGGTAIKTMLLGAIGRLSSVRIAVMPLEGWLFVPNPLRLEPEAARAPSAGPVRLLAVGSFGALKGSDTLVDAVAALRASGCEVRLRFVGRELRRGEEAALRRRVDDRGLTGAVTFAGVLAPEPLREEYRNADVFCLPSRREGMPMALVEAMAFELPAVATPVGAVPMFVEDGRTGLLVQPGDVDALAAAIRSLATDEALRKRLGRAGAERVQALCAPGEVAKRWRELYAEAAA